jgi:hypothetical protein
MKTRKFPNIEVIIVMGLNTYSTLVAWEKSRIWSFSFVVIRKE